MRKAGFLFVTSVFAILVAGVAHADIASTKYVDDKIATKEDLGAVKIGDNIDVEDGTISVPKAAGTEFGVVSGRVTTDSVAEDGSTMGIGFYDGVLNIPVAMSDDYYESKPGLVSVSTYPWDADSVGTATPTTSFLHSVPSVLHVRSLLQDKLNAFFPDTEDEDGMPISSDKNTVITVDGYGYAGPHAPGTGLSVADDGTLSVKTATDKVLGAVKIGSNISVNSGTISVPEATVDMNVDGEPSFQTGVVKVWSKHIDDSCAGNTCAEYIDPNVSNDADDLVPTVAFVQAQVDGMVSAGIDADEWEQKYSSELDSNAGGFPATLYYEDGKPLVKVAERLDASVLPLATQDEDNGFLPGAVYVADSTQEVEDIVEVVGEENLRSVVPSANLVESFLGETLASFMEGKQDTLNATGAKNVPVYVSAKGVVSSVTGTTVPVGGATYDANEGWATIWIE